MSDQILYSSQDASVNFITTHDKGLIEARYVRRCDDYFIVYLSSQTGCRMACRFCHLTATRQVQDADVDLDGYLAQANKVLNWYDQQMPARVVHFNFMARGEALANQHVLARADELIDRLGMLAIARGLVPSFKFSTIMPRLTMTDRALTQVFRRSQPDIYYSLYSLDPAFRRRWLPAALDPMTALRALVGWQQVTHKLPVLHWAFIEGQNDSEADIEAITAAVCRVGLRADFNIVRYNPPTPVDGREPDESIIERNAQLLRSGVPGSRVQVVQRVGFDVKASCGMFVGRQDY